METIGKFHTSLMFGLEDGKILIGKDLFYPEMKGGKSSILISLNNFFLSQKTEHKEGRK